MSSVFDAKFTHLTRTRAYLRSLPNGLASYPEARSKGFVWKNIHSWTDTTSLQEKLPSDPELLPSRAVLAGSWIPAVQSFAGHLVLRDCLFSSDEAIIEHFRAMDRELMSSPVYRVLFALASPAMAVRGASRSFAAMFQGLALHGQSSGGNSVDLALQYPAALLPSLVARLYLVAFEVAVELAGGKSVVGRMIGHGLVQTTFTISWE